MCSGQQKHTIMPSSMKAFSAALVLTLFVGAYSSHHNKTHNCFQCISGEERVEKCFANMMANMGLNFSFTPLNHGFEKKSISPWEYKDDIDEMRYPQRIETAECIKIACPPNTTNEEIRALIYVFKREKCFPKTNLFKLRMVPYEVVVGCTCIKI